MTNAESDPQGVRKMSPIERRPASPTDRCSMPITAFAPNADRCGKPAVVVEQEGADIGFFCAKHDPQRQRDKVAQMHAETDVTLAERELLRCIRQEPVDQHKVEEIRHRILLADERLRLIVKKRSGKP